ncbi:MAG: hypothetical protein QME85_03630 [Candidatus Saccharicenans sp.]|nr:hypothetical protein [Candidatus Saccharicenans sp.]
MDLRAFQKQSIRLLVLFNLTLLVVSWAMMLRAYPQLPQEIPYWLNLAGQEILRTPKSPLLFIYPVAQSLFLIVFWLAGSVWVRKPDRPAEMPELQAALTDLKKELVLLFMIFFNLIFIHIQRSLIWLARGAGAGVNKFYFFSLIIIILLLVPYYRFRRTLIMKLSR